MGTLHKTKKIWSESSIQKTLIERFMSESNIKYICENLFIFKGWESDLILITKSKGMIYLLANATFYLSDSQGS